MDAIDGRERGGSYPSRRVRTSLSLILLGIILLAFFLVLRSDVLGQSYQPRYRFGVGVLVGCIEDYDVAQLRAGWYLDWHARLDPAEPAGLEYAQMVRLHQMTECWPDRVKDCPYTTPYTYTLTTPGNASQVVYIAQANPGSLWLIGNEMDRRDWDGGGQDEMLPEVYAWAYHELYHLIKSADPTAQIAIGGVIQPTPLRLEYLDRVLAEYQSRYGAMIPVDVWNIHNMILPERADSYGAQIPPGLSDTEGRTYGIQDADNIEIFRQHILDFRQWMDAKGERDKPLIISEYSVLYGDDYGFDYPRVSDYLYATFDTMTTATDASLGYPADCNRLVQRWAWYSLNDDGFEGYPSQHHLFDPDTKQITQLGIDYGAYPDDSTMQSVSLGVGWNHIALSVESSLSYDAEDLCQQIENQGGQAAEIDRWYAGGWQGHICGLSFNNFPIELGKGYFVKSGASSVWTVGCRQVTEPVSLDLAVGWNSISIPHTDTYTAESLCNEIISQGVTAVEIDRWYAGGWQGHICGLPFNDFPIEPGKGYFIKADSAGLVTPAGQSAWRQ